MTLTMSRPSAPAGARRGGALTGTGTLLRFMLRRDRVRLPAWTLGIALLMAYFVTALRTVLATPEDLRGMAGFSGSPIGALFGGPGYGYDALTIERFLAGQYGLYILVGAGLMSVLTVTRHTRAEERSGRAELVRAGVVGRHAQLTAALTLTTLMNALVALLIAGLMSGSGFDGAGSLLFGAAVGAAGLAFAGVTAISAQLFEYPRAASGLAGAVLGAAFVLRGIGDMAATHGSWLSWLSPIGWSQQTAAYVLDRWWPLGLSVAFAAVTAALGYLLSARRDLAAGLVPPRPGPATAAPWLRSGAALAFRLQRAQLIGWSLALLVAGLSYGLFTQPVIDGFADAPKELLAVMGGEEDMLAGFLGLMGLMMAFTVAVFAVLSLQGLRAEETEGRTEPVLATAVGRTGWLAANLAVTALGVLWLLFVAGLAMGVGAALSTGDAGLLGELVAGHVAHTPAVWLVLAVAALLYGALPRALPLVWLIVVYGMIVGFFAPILHIPDSAVNLSPFEHIGEYPLEDVSVPATLALTALAVLVAGAALAAFRRRDIICT
ncbi:ABC transporter permease [Microtetraspora niveoalba]|uniref:ABC transporter permease n=1 Tax=Microtetraspora niveoalba TaxID=46175 RepID=UPI000AC50C37|nr:ABC transporter permease [Microtetraspora niveoalba]